ncbi:MAG: hypothetical protein IJQ57_10360 [Synergistaceae bacterium]|nr:hypothetical protein [Synergistaceae bacterium]
MKYIKKLFVLGLFIALTCKTCHAELWQNPNLNISELNKVFIMPFNSKLEAGTQLMPKSQLNNSFAQWASNAIHEAVKKHKIKLTVKSLDALLEDMNFIYGDKNSANDEKFFERAKEMGYNAFVTCNVEQKFNVEHVPEKITTYTVYRDIEKRDRNGNIIEIIRIPEQKTDITPAHDVTFLNTVCEPKLFFINDVLAKNDDYMAASRLEIYREYQGGPVMKVVENIINSAIKDLFTVNEDTGKKGRKRK